MWYEIFVLGICLGLELLGYMVTLLNLKKIFFFFWPSQTVHGSLVPQPWIEPMPTALSAWSLNTWTAREVLSIPYLIIQNQNTF